MISVKNEPQISTDKTDQKKGKPLSKLLKFDLYNPCSSVADYSSKLDADTELRLLLPEHAEDFFSLVDSNRQRLAEWMFWVTEDYSLADAQRPQ